MKRAETNDDFYKIPMQDIDIKTIPDGEILDIGGGGEGIIAQIGGKRVTAIDKLQSEIEEAKVHAPDANWICADATSLEFPDEHFNNATAFFSGMYMDDETLKTSFKEIHRVLKDNGEFWIWDAVIDYDVGPFVIFLKIHIPSSKIITTGYGRRTVDKDRNVDDLNQLLIQAGFKTEIMEKREYWYFIKAKK